MAVPAAIVNSGLKYVQKRIQLAFMRRLSHNLHEHYTTARAYYAASTLGGELYWRGGRHIRRSLISQVSFAGRTGAARAMQAATVHH